MGFFRSRNTVTRADKISSFTVNTAEYGAPVMEILGTTRVSGNVIYYDDFTAHAHSETQKTGKGGGSKHTNITYTYTVAVIIGLCEGPISGIGRVWKTKDLYNYPDDRLSLTLHNGAANQQPWSYVVGAHPDKALPYSGLAYMAGVIDLGDSGSMPSYNFEVFGKMLETGDGTDVNPMDYILYVLSKVGQGNASFSGADHFRSYCANADLLISTPADATGTQEAQKIVNEIAEICGAYIFNSNNTYKIVPLENRPVGGWEPDNTIRYDLTEDDFIPENGTCVQWSRKDSSEQYNRWTVEYLSRANGYEKESVSYEDAADIAERGVKQAPTIQAGYIYTKARAVKIAEAAARRSMIGKNRYTVKLDWPFCRLEPGDKVRITDEASGISNQVVIIENVKEDEKGLPVITALSWFDGEYGPAQYDVHEVDRPFVNFNAPAADTAAPVIFQPPADLTTNGLEVWIAAKGAGENWGGCMVYISDDNEYYRTLGQISVNARIGPLAAGISAAATSLEVAINGTMLSGSAQDAQRANTLLWIGGECLSYQTATLLGNGNYKLDGLIRGQYNTTPAAHGSGSIVVRCDEALLRAPFAKEDIGKKVWLKFCSLNIFGAGEQSLADVQASEYTLQPYFVPPVRQLTVRNRYRQLKDGVTRYDIVAEWDPPDLQSFYEARVWYKTNTAQTKYLNFAQGVKANELGFSGEWIYGGSGKMSAVIPQAVVGDTYRIAVTTVDIWGVETSPDASPQTDILVALRTETPNTPDGFTISFGSDAVASWKEVVNSDIAWYEVRKDQAPGEENVNLLARVTGLKAVLPITERAGVLYLYAYSAAGKYSAPAQLEYSKTAPPKPAAPYLTGKLGGFALEAGAIPYGCNGMNIYIDGTDTVVVHTVNNVYTHACDAGIYDVSVAYTDIFGEGEHSPETRITIKATVDAALLEAQAVTKEKLSLALQGNIDDAIQSVQDLLTINGNINTINGSIAAVEAAAAGIVTELNKAPGSCGYTSISTLKTTTDTISSTVATNKTTQDGINTTLGTQITQTNSSIAAVVANLNQGPSGTTYNSITQLKTSIDGLSSQVTQVIDNMQQGMQGDISVLASQVSQNATDISSIVSNLNQGPSGTTYASISQLKQQADSISSTVTSNKNAQDTVNSGFGSRITQTENGISAIVGNLATAAGARTYTALQLLQDGIASKVSQGDVSSWLQQDHTGFYIKGSLIQIDATTVIGNSIISSNMIQTGAVTADKMSVTSLSAISAVLGTLRTATSGARLEIVDSNLIKVYDANGTLRVQMGVW